MDYEKKNLGLLSLFCKNIYSVYYPLFDKETREMLEIASSTSLDRKIGNVERSYQILKFKRSSIPILYTPLPNALDNIDIFGRYFIALVGYDQKLLNRKISSKEKGMLKRKAFYFIYNKYNIQPNSIVYFDDNSDIINQVKSLGVRTHKVKSEVKNRNHCCLQSKHLSNIIKFNQKNPGRIKMVITDFSQTLLVEDISQRDWNSNDIPGMINRFFGGLDRLKSILSMLKKLSKMGIKIGILSFQPSEFIQQVLVEVGMIKTPSSFSQSYPIQPRSTPPVTNPRIYTLLRLKNLDYIISLTKNYLGEQKRLDKERKEFKYSKYWRLLDPFYLQRDVVSIIGNAENVSNAWLKCYEMLTVFNLIPVQLVDSQFLHFDNAAFPGSFIISTHHLVNTHREWWQEYKWVASSLDEQNKTDQDPLEDNYELYKNYPQNWLMTPNNNGDVLIKANLLDFHQRIGGTVDLYTSDLGFSVEGKESDQEIFQLPANIGQILAGLLTLKQGGSFMTKQFSFFHPATLSIMYATSIFFEEFYIYKPETSRQANSETYLIGKGFKGAPLNHPYIQGMFDRIEGKVDYEIPMFSKEDIEDYIEYMFFFPGLSIYTRQISKINMDINRIGKISSRYKGPPELSRNIIHFSELNYDSLGNWYERMYILPISDSRKLKMKYVVGFGNYQDQIYNVAEILKPKISYKFKSKFGLKQLSNQAVQIDKNVFLQDVLSNITNFYITDKVDGERMLIYIDRAGSVWGLSDRLTNFGQLRGSRGKVYIFDTERHGDMNYIFDVMCYESKLLINEPFENRKRYFPSASGLSGRVEGLVITEKPFIKLTNNFRQQIVDLELRTNKGYPTDGYVFTPSDKSYYNMIAYKYKPLSQLTIDFLIKKCPTTLLGTPPYTPSEGKEMYLLFCGIDIRTAQKLRMQVLDGYSDIFPADFYEKTYFPIQFQPSDNKYAYLYESNDPNLDGYVGEFLVGNPDDSQVNYYWELLRIRHDRKVEVDRGNYFGNNYKIAELTWMSYQDHLIIEQLTDNDLKVYFQKHDNLLHKQSRDFNKFVKSQILSTFTGKNSVFDISSGKGQDLFLYSDNRNNKVLFTDNDATALSELIRRKFEFAESRIRGRGNNPMEILVQNIDFTTNHNDIIRQIELSGIDIPHTGFDIIRCSLAFHYFCGSAESIENIGKLISQYLKTGGRFVFTSFDGSAVFDLLKQNGGVWESKERGKFYLELEDKDNNNIKPYGEVVKVLLPFSSGELYSEYLVNIKYISSIFAKYGLELEEKTSDYSFSEYLPNYRNASMMDDDDKLYTSLYHYYSFRKVKQIQDTVQKIMDNLSPKHLRKRWGDYSSPSPNS